MKIYESKPAKIFNLLICLTILIIGVTMLAIDLNMVSLFTTGVGLWATFMSIRKIKGKRCIIEITDTLIIFPFKGKIKKIKLEEIARVERKIDLISAAGEPDSYLVFTFRNKDKPIKVSLPALEYSEDEIVDIVNGIVLRFK